MESNENGLIRAYVLDGTGGGKVLAWDEIAGWTADQGTLWIHLDRTNLAARRWIREASGLDATVIDALLAKGSRPRSVDINGGLMVLLRGINLNPGEDPVDMVSIRMFVESDRIISVRRNPMMAIQDIWTALDAGSGPTDTAEFLAMTAEQLVERMWPLLTDVEDELDRLEDQMSDPSGRPSRRRLADLPIIHAFL